MRTTPLRTYAYGMCEALKRKGVLRKGVLASGILG